MRLGELRNPNQAAPTLDASEYPSRWPDFIGQKPAVAMLRDAAKSARIRKAPMDHVFIAHPTPGLGKTALANLVALEMRQPIRVVSGKVTRQKARIILSQMEDRHVLVYDEFHQVAGGNKADSEWLLHFLQDNVLMGPRGPELQPRITLIAATTHPQKVPQAVRERFMLEAPMQDYDVEEAAKIAQLTGVRILESEKLPRLTRAEGVLVAQAADCNPRMIKKLLIGLRDGTQSGTLKLDSGRYDLAGMLARRGMTPDGLNPAALRYLEALAVDFDGQAGLKALEEHLGQPGGLGEIERSLMNKGLITRGGSRGRILTTEGISRYNELAS